MNTALPIPLLKIKEDDICAEIGVWKGYNACKILKQEPRELHLIDPWAHQDYEGRWYSVEQKKMDDIYENVCDSFKEEDRVYIHRGFSKDVIFPNEYFDWIYIDGNHSYSSVLEDLNHYRPFMKRSGFMCGDDYGWKDRHCDKGPKAAVDEFTKINNLKLEIHPGTDPWPIDRSKPWDQRKPSRQFIITLK